MCVAVLFSTLYNRWFNKLHQSFLPLMKCVSLKSQFSNFFTNVGASSDNFVLCSLALLSLSLSLLLSHEASDHSFPTKASPGH